MLQRLLEAPKLILGYAASHEHGGLHVMLCDVKRAYFQAKASRELYVELPHEDPCWSADEVGRLNLALYRTRDAATLWQECVADHLEGVGFRRGRSNPCVFFHKHREL